MLHSKLVLSTLFASSMVIACGDDEIDPPPPPVDDGDEDVVALTDQDGGNILFEFIYFDTELQAAFGLPNGVTTAQRIMAFFLESQTPENSALPGPGVCNNLTEGWPMFVGDPHVDLDIGTLTITGKNTADEDVTVTPALQSASTDSIGRPHDTYYQIIQPPAEDFIKANSAYTVSFSGKGDVPATTFTDGLFMSDVFTVNSPDLEDNGPLVANADFNVKWTPLPNKTPQGDDILGIAWLVDSNGSPTHMCPTLHSVGEFTIPAATIAEYRAVATARGANPDKVILLRNAVVHKLSRLPNGGAEDPFNPDNKRRIDMLTVHCWAQLMDCEAAP